MSTIDIRKGSILDFEGDAIVNPANSWLRHDGGLARIIADAAAPYRFAAFAKHANEGSGPRLDVEWQEAQADHPLIPVGGAGITDAGALPFKAIIHAVGPVWGGGHFHEHDLLFSAHTHAYAEARINGFTSIAFPAISCGIFGFPVEEAAEVAIRAIRFAQTLDEKIDAVPMGVAFFLFEDAHEEAYQKAKWNR